MIACLLLVGSGCATVKKEEGMRHIDPPDDFLEPKAASPTRYLKNIKVVNGQGETIAEGQVGQTMGSIPIEKLDPSTTIIHTYSDGFTETFNLPPGPVTQAGIEWRPSTRKYQHKSQHLTYHVPRRAKALDLPLGSPMEDPELDYIFIENGKGDVLYDEAWLGDWLYFNPLLEDLDGTLKITEVMEDGTKRTHVVTHEPHTRVDLVYNFTTETYEVEKLLPGTQDMMISDDYETQPGLLIKPLILAKISQDLNSRAVPGPWQIGIAGGFGQMEGTRFGIGTIDKGGNEQSLAKSDDRVEIAYVHTHVSYDLGPQGKFYGTRVYLSGNYQFGQDTDSEREEAGGSTVALTYDRNASNGSTGVGPLTGGAEAQSENKMRGLDLRIGLTGDLNLMDGLILSPNINLSYKGVWQMGSGNFRSIAFGDAIYSKTEQDLDDHYYGLGTGGYLTKSYQDSGVSTFIGGELTGYFRDTELKSEQVNRCSVGGCTAVNNFTAKVNDDDSGFTYGVVGRAGVSLDLIHDFKFGVIGAVEYLKERGDVVNRENPAQSVKRVETDDALDWNVGLFLRKNF